MSNTIIKLLKCIKSLSRVLIILGTLATISCLAYGWILTYIDDKDSQKVFDKYKETDDEEVTE